jgi:hypothetical protein
MDVIKRQLLLELALRPDKADAIIWLLRRL